MTRNVEFDSKLKQFQGSANQVVNYVLNRENVAPANSPLQTKLTSLHKRLSVAVADVSVHSGLSAACQLRKRNVHVCVCVSCMYVCGSSRRRRGATTRSTTSKRIRPRKQRWSPWYSAPILPHPLPPDVRCGVF
jgi:hypothetical protein